MKKISSVLIPMLVLATLLISACTGAAAPASTSGGGKVEAAPVEFTGVIESMNGNQWVVGGQTITVDPSVIGDGPFVVGDTVKVEVEVQTDGSILVTRVEAPTSTGNSNDTNSNDTNSNDASGNVNSNDSTSNSNSSDGNSNDGGLVFDNSGTEAFGTVESITVDTVVIGGQTFTIANGAEFKDQILAGDFVKVHFTLNADGTLSITEIETWDPALVTNDNSNTSINDNGNASNSNDDNSNDDNSNDDNGNDDNSNDDNGNDDDSDDDNGNDDSSDDDNGNDDDSEDNSNTSNGNGG